MEAGFVARAAVDGDAGKAGNILLSVKFLTVNQHR
jgi:hypothetical protein